jgi:hypothetical protein
MKSADRLCREIACTGLGNGPTLRQRWRGAAKALTWFRESATPDGHLDDFSNAYPRPRGHPHLPGENPQIPIFRHFSVIRRGIKT